MNDILWNPSKERQQASLLQEFVNHLPISLTDYEEIHKWSISNMEEFWAHFWNFSGIKYSKNYDSVLSNNIMPGARWFEGSRLNFAENLLRFRDDRTALIFWGEDKTQQRLTNAQLYQSVSSLAAHLRQQGVGRPS